MDEEAFWGIVERSHGVEEELADILRHLQPEEIAQFERRFLDKRILAYRWDIWAAAYWLGGGCSDDGFMDFRSGLIFLGRERFEAVLKNPDELADIVGQPGIPYLFAEHLQYVAGDAYEQKTAQSIYDAIEVPRAPELSNDPGSGYFDFNDVEEMRQRFPRLVAKYPNGGNL